MKDFILHRKNALSSTECKNIIDFFESNKDLHINPEYPPRDGIPMGSGTLKVMPTPPSIRKCTEMYLRESPINEFLGKGLNECLEDYKKDYPFVEKLGRWSCFNTFKVQKYNPGEGYFALHCENDHVDGQAEYRVLGWMFYLNNVYDGGYTEFTNQEKKFQPREGDCLIWPAYFTHTHKGIVSKTETKYIVTGWFSYNM